MASEIGEALGAGQMIEWGGVQRRILPLDFNDLIVIEEEFGSVDALDLEKVKTQRFVAWLILRKTQPELTEDEVGKLLLLGQFGKVSEFLMQIFEIAGLVSQEEKEDPKPVAAKPKKGASAA